MRGQPISSQGRQIQFRGGAGCLFLLALVLVPEIFQLATKSGAQAQVQVGIIARLQARYTQQLMDERATDDPEFAPRIAAINNVQITSFSLRTFGPGATARVGVQINGQAPPDGVTVRYFNLKQQVWGAWWASGEVNSTFYDWRPW